MYPWFAEMHTNMIVSSLGFVQLLFPIYFFLRRRECPFYRLQGKHRRRNENSSLAG